ncbi:hypothetical protein PRIPAC_89259 [Pristionchus pacificus]|uniref:Uncharacterized protein n=1 Tax=Pristionchus pacificus TaxID=54126 RepID=A0A2A6CXD1_PRIPA|nr:hypothetical protein PRIPAC_89259 [Pristionchus pacificus]|eukprot:PDM82819.1 hypothetical protein PRIPAC_37212 [Pristionchus pacificus]
MLREYNTVEELQKLLELELRKGGARLVLEKYRSELLKHGRIVISADKATSDVFESVLSETFGDKLTRLANYECGLFYMIAEQRDSLLSMEIVPPDVFTLQPVDEEKDVEIIHSCWKNAISLEITKQVKFLISRPFAAFPRFALAIATGILLAGQFHGRFGQISHEFVVPEHRGKGVGRALELMQAQLLARKGRRVVKDVDTDNTFITISFVDPVEGKWRHKGQLL